MRSKPQAVRARSSDESTRTVEESLNQGYEQFLSSLSEEQKKQDRINQQKQKQILVEFARDLAEISGE
jgi:hypothetical protein